MGGYPNPLLPLGRISFFKDSGESRGFFLFIVMRKKDRDNKIGIYLDTTKEDSEVVQAALLGLNYKWKGGRDIILDLELESTIIINLVAKNKFIDWNGLSPEENLLNDVFALYKISEVGVVNAIQFAINPPKPTPDKFNKLPLVEFEYFDGINFNLTQIRVDNVNNTFFFGYDILDSEAKKTKYERVKMRNINFLEFGGEVIDESDAIINNNGNNSNQGQGGGRNN